MEKIKKRENESEKMKEIILKAASEIVEEEGFEQLSIRKIAKKIEYTPAIIYHYFKDKDTIIGILLKKSYNQMVCMLMEKTNDSWILEMNSQWKPILEMTDRYFQMILEWKQTFLNVQISRNEQVSQQTFFLQEGALQKKGALVALASKIEEILDRKEITKTKEEIEIQAQLIAVSSWGLAVKIILEDINEKRARELIHSHMQSITIPSLEHFIMEGNENEN